jgi:hypothetical protein
MIVASVVVTVLLVQAVLILNGTMINIVIHQTTLQSVVMMVVTAALEIVQKVDLIILDLTLVRLTVVTVKIV